MLGKYVTLMILIKKKCSFFFFLHHSSALHGSLIYFFLFLFRVFFFFGSRKKKYGVVARYQYDTIRYHGDDYVVDSFTHSGIWIEIFLVCVTFFSSTGCDEKEDIKLFLLLLIPSSDSRPSAYIINIRAVRNLKHFFKLDLMEFGVSNSSRWRWTCLFFLFFQTFFVTFSLSNCLLEKIRKYIHTNTTCLKRQRTQIYYSFIH